MAGLDKPCHGSAVSWRTWRFSESLSCLSSETSWSCYRVHQSRKLDAESSIQPERRYDSILNLWTAI